MDDISHHQIRSDELAQSDEVSGLVDQTITTSAPRPSLGTPAPLSTTAAAVQLGPLKSLLEVEALVRALTDLDLDQLRVHWRKLSRSSPPNLPRPLLMRLLAYRLQARAFGDLDRQTARYLDKVARQRERDRLAGARKPKAVPPVPPVLRARLSPGTLLAREFNGEMHRVTVTADGFAWQGSTYQSLSEIARLITGTRWSGPRFFGLRDGPSAATTTGEAP